MGSSDFPSMKAAELMSLLLSLGYRVVRSKGSHQRLEHPELNPLTFAFHSKKEIPGGLVRQYLVRQAGLTLEKAKEAVR